LHDREQFLYWKGLEEEAAATPPAIYMTDNFGSAAFSASGRRMGGCRQNSAVCLAGLRFM